MPRSTPTRGFTLLELLIALSIIAVLAMLLFPVVMQARRSARRALCLSNLRQLAAAMLLYVDDHDETFPDTGNQFLWTGRQWRPLLEPYVPDRKAFWCPADTRSERKYDATSYAYMQTFYHARASINAGPAAMRTATDRAYHTCGLPTAPQALGDVAYPARKILIFEWYSNHDREVSTLWSSKGMHAAACVDGHVALVRQERLRLSALGDHDPNWTQDGVAGWDLE